MGRKREEKKEEGRREEEENPGMEFMFGTSLLFGIFVWNISFSLELLYLLVWNLFVWICWLGNPHSSLFAYVWGLKNHIYV